VEGVQVLNQKEGLSSGSEEVGNLGKQQVWMVALREI
jgi:hypothetical protein